MTDFRAPIDQNKQEQKPVEENISAKTVQPVKAPVVQPSIVNQEVSQKSEIKIWPLDNFIKKLVSFVAKMTWQPDPITWAANIPTMSWNVAQKVWNTTNDAISTVGNVADKFTDVAKKTVEVANWAVNQVKEIKQDIKASINPEIKPTQSLDNLEKTE